MKHYYDLPKEKEMTLSDTLRAFADSYDMQTAAGIEPVYQHTSSGDAQHLIKDSSHTFIDGYEFPLAVVEGRAVFVGDVLYNTSAKATDGSEFIVSYATVGLWNTEGRGGFAKDLSWNKPKTVMVELLVEDAKSVW